MAGQRRARWSRWTRRRLLSDRPGEHDDSAGDVQPAVADVGELDGGQLGGREGVEGGQGGQGGDGGVLRSEARSGWCRGRRARGMLFAGGAATVLAPLRRQRREDVSGVIGDPWATG